MRIGRSARRTETDPTTSSHPSVRAGTRPPTQTLTRFSGGAGVAGGSKGLWRAPGPTPSHCDTPRVPWTSCKPSPMTPGESGSRRLSRPAAIVSSTTSNGCSASRSSARRSRRADPRSRRRRRPSVPGLGDRGVGRGARTGWLARAGLPQRTARCRRAARRRGRSVGRPPSPAPTGPATTARRSRRAHGPPLRRARPPRPLRRMTEHRGVRRTML
jgi:hypothetical protein